MVVFIFWSTKEAIREFPSSGYGDVSELDLATYVAKSVDVVDAGVLVIVGYDMPSLMLLDADILEAEVFDFG